MSGHDCAAKLLDKISASEEILTSLETQNTTLSIVELADICFTVTAAYHAPSSWLNMLDHRRQLNRQCSRYDAVFLTDSMAHDLSFFEYQRVRRCLWLPVSVLSRRSSVYRSC